MEKSTFNMPGTIKANDENNLLWEYQGWVGRSDDIGNAEENIEDVADVQKVLSQMPQVVAGNKVIFEFSPLQGPPLERKITNGGGPPLCKFGPGGDYMTEYTPKTSRSLRTVPAWITRMLTGQIGRAHV